MSTQEPRWRRMFTAVLTELDPEKVPVRLITADDSIFYRLLELEGRPEMEEERLELEDALEDIKLLRTNCYHLGNIEE